MPHPRFEITSFSSSQFCISSFIHHSTQNPPFPTLIHLLIHTDLMVNGWHRVEPLPRSHAPICLGDALIADRKSTRLNSSHVRISYAVFCFKKNTSSLISN